MPSSYARFIVIILIVIIIYCNYIFTNFSKILKYLTPHFYFYNITFYIVVMKVHP